MSPGTSPRSRHSSATRTTAASSISLTSGPVDASDARRVTLEQAGILLRMARENPVTSGSAPPSPRSRLPRPSVRWRRSSTSRGPRRSVPSLGGAEVLHAAGLRSIGPVWSRPNAFGAAFPSASRRSRRGPGPDAGRQGPASAPATGWASSSTSRTSTPPASATSPRSRRAARRHPLERPRASRPRRAT